MAFVEKYEYCVDPDDSRKTTIDPNLMSPELNPDRWLDVCAILSLP